MSDENACYGPLYFVQSGYDRQSLRRGRSRYLERCLDDGSARLLFVFERKVGVHKHDHGLVPALLEPGLVPLRARERLEAVYLGEYGSGGIFSIHCDEHPRGLLSLGSEPILFFDLRQAAALLEPEAASLLGYALAMDNWHRGHRFCGVCGNPTEPGLSGHMRACTNRDCGRRQFPRTDPAVIVLVHDGESCLLGRKPEWPDRRYSTIAGFVEPGETPEQALRREVYEETGVVVEEVDYLAAQPWPFPGSLMLGYHATAKRTDTIRLLDNELQDARWFTRDEIAEWVPLGRLRLPTRISIAYRLLETWFDLGDGPRLAEIDAGPGN